MSKRPGRPNGGIEQAGKVFTADSLPPAHTDRWVIRRKAEAVTAVRNRPIVLDEARGGCPGASQQIQLTPSDTVHEEGSVMSSIVKEYNHANPRRKPSVLHLEIELDPSSSLNEVTQAARDIIHRRLARLRSEHIFPLETD